MKEDLKQFKLNSGSEILCEVIAWPPEGEKEIVIKNVMEIKSVNHTYVFRPWLHYLEGPTESAILNLNAIVAMAIPNQYLALQYHRALDEMWERSEYRDEEYQKESADFRSLAEIHEELKEIFDNHLREDEVDFDNDSNGKSNIIKFPVIH